MDKPTYAAAAKMVTKYNSTQKLTKAIKRKQLIVEPIATYGSQKIGQKPNIFQKPSGNQHPCNRCRHQSHKSSQCQVLAKGIICKTCGKRGHLALVCWSGPPKHPMRAYKFTLDKDTNSSNEDDEEISIHPEVMPRLNILISHTEGCFNFQAFPDSGGSTIMITSDLAQRKKINVNYPQTPKFVAVNGVKLRINGLATITIKNLNNVVGKNFAVIVSPDVTEDILIGYPHLKELGVISKKFPFSTFNIHNTNNFEEIKTTICNEFPNTVRDSLTEKAMEGPPCKSPYPPM